MKTKEKDSLERRIVFYIQSHKNVTMPKLALALGESNEGPTDLEIHGKQHRISQAIERLRRRDLIKDVAERCITCTRAKRNRSGSVVLQLTTLGSQFGIATALPRLRTLREMTDIMHGVTS